MCDQDNQESINALDSLVHPISKLLEMVNKAPEASSPSNGCPHKKDEPNGESSNIEQIDELPRSSGCPFFNGPSKQPRVNSVNKKFPEWQTSVSVAAEPLFYNEYLKLDKILNAQFPESQKYGQLAHDEHLFIVVHQTYELWFKQIIFEIDSIRDLLGKSVKISELKIKKLLKKNKKNSI